MRLSYYKNLDGVRAVAALMVMTFHFFQSLGGGAVPPAFLAKVAVFGQTGVDLFFVLSGFLITRILLATKSGPDYFRNFYLRRSLRIFPLYYLFLLLYYFIFPLIFNEQTPGFGQQVYYYTYLQNFALTFNWNAAGPEHFWSLGVEEHFYLFWPLAVYFLSNTALKRLSIGIIVASLLLRVWMVNQGYSVFYFTFTRFDALAAGALLALLELKNYFTKRNAAKFAGLLAVLFVPAVMMWTLFTGEGNNYIQIFKFLLFSFVYFSFIGLVVCLDQNHFLNRILNTKFLNYTGKISYGLYVYHLFVYQLCNRFLHLENLILEFVIKFAATFLLSTLSFYLFESSFLKLKKYFEYDRKKKPVESLTGE